MTQNGAMAKRTNDVELTLIAADPDQWSAQSKRSVAFHFKREYVDEPYKCWRCGAACVFTAQDQKYTFEVKKASIDQRRKFCTACWSESHRVSAAIAERENRWADGKNALRADGVFLTEWLELLMRWKEFEPYKLDIAKIHMLRDLLGLK